STVIYKPSRPHNTRRLLRLDRLFVFFFFFNDTATTEIYTLSLHDALPISNHPRSTISRIRGSCGGKSSALSPGTSDRKSTRLNSSHLGISYAVFCLKQHKNRQGHGARARTMRGERADRAARLGAVRNSRRDWPLSRVESERGGYAYHVRGLY